MYDAVESVLQAYPRSSTYSPDISKHIEYLEEAGYIVFTSRTANAYNAYRKDAIIKLTKKGVDLLENTIEDPGVNV